MQKKLTTRDGLKRKFILTKNDGGKPVQTVFNLSPTMKDIEIKKAVQAGVPLDLFEPMKGFDEEYEKLGKLRSRFDSQKRATSKTVRAKLLNLDGSEFKMDEVKTAAKATKGKKAATKAEE